MIKVSPAGKTSVKLSNQEHVILSDISVANGGEDQGLNPHELVEAALGACTSLTLGMYARRKGWDLGNLLVDVKITKEGKESVFERVITFDPKTPKEDREKLLVIADKCPIHNLLESSIKIETKEA